MAPFISESSKVIIPQRQHEYISNQREVASALPSKEVGPEEHPQHVDC